MLFLIPDRNLVTPLFSQMFADLKLDLGILGGALRQTRERLRISLRKLSQSSGVSPSQILRIESGEFDCLVTSLVRIGAALGIRLPDLLQSCVLPDYEFYRTAVENEGLNAFPNDLRSVPNATEAFADLVFGGAVILAYLLRSPRPATLVREFYFPTREMWERFARIASALDSHPPSLETRLEFLSRLQKEPAATLSRFYGFPTLEQIEAHAEGAMRHKGKRIFAWVPIHAVPGFEDPVGSTGPKKDLPAITPSCKSPPMTRQLESVIERTKRACEPRGSGIRKRLAKFLGVPMPRISEWLKGTKSPGGETTLRLLEWLTAEEARQHQNAGTAGDKKSAPSVKPGKPATSARSKRSTSKGKS